MRLLDPSLCFDCLGHKRDETYSEASVRDDDIDVLVMTITKANDRETGGNRLTIDRSILSLSLYVLLYILSSGG